MKFFNLNEITSVKANNIIIGATAVIGILGGIYLLTQTSKITQNRIAERKSAKKKKDGQTVCNVCFTPIDTDDSKTCIACCSCAKNVCRGDKCSEWIPKEGEWQCQLCAAHRDSYGKASTWVEEQNAVKRASHAEFSYGMRARSEIYIPVCDPNESAFLCNFESVSEAASPVHPIQKKHIREYIEEVLADMIGGSLESATVEPIAMTNGNYQQVRNGHELQGISNVRLRRLIESIIAETVRQPPFSSAGLIATTSIDSNDVGIDGREILPMNGNGNICNGNGGQYFESKKYQDLLATAVLNKIVNTHGNGRHSESSPDLTTSSVLDNNHNALNLTKTDESISSSSSVEPRSESSLTDPTLNINKNDELLPNIKYEKFYDDAANDNIDADRESVLSDFISSHMVPLPHISTEPASDDDEEDEDEDFISVTSSRDATWEDNWLFKKKKSNKTSSSVGMLVPAPKEDVRTLIGDKPTDEVSDLSEVGSDTDDSSLEMVSASLEPMNDRLVNKHLIGGKNTKVILDELVDRTSMISTSSLPDNVPPYTETKNEFVVSNDGLNESSQPLKISVNNCTKAISNEAINSNVSKPITVNKVEKHVKDTDGPEDESIVPPPNDFTDDEKMRNLLAKFNEEQNNKADSGDDNSSSLSPRSSISCALSAGIDRAELDAYEGITDFSVEDEEGLASDIDAAMGESSSRRPSVIEILAAIALGPMLAVSASDDRNILTEVELSSLMELNELAMAQMGSKSPEDRRLDVIAEESFDSNTPDERKMDFVDVNDEDDLLSSPKMVMDAIRELVGRDAVRFRRSEDSSIQIEEITGISDDFIAEGCTITEIETESPEEQLNVKAIKEEVQQPVPELKEEIAIEEINDNATVSLSEDLGFEKIIPDNTSSISDESLHTIGSSSDGSDFEGDTTCFSCDDTNTSIKDGNTVDEFILRPPTAFCDEQSRTDNECVATRATEAHINSDTVETNEQITTENETHTEETQIETVGNDDKAISNLREDIKEVEKNVSIFETVVEVHHHSEERTEITGDNQNIPKPEEEPGDESQVTGGILETVNPETAQETPSSEAVSSAEVIDEKSPQENEIEGTKKEVDELHESAEKTDGKTVIAPPPLRVLSEAQLNEDQLSSVKVSEEISTSTGESEVLEVIPVEESVSDKSTEEDKLQQQISNLETNVDSEENISGSDETAIGTQSEEQISEKVEGNEEPKVESVEVALNEQNVEHVSAEMSDIASTPARNSGSQGLISDNSNASSAPAKIETSDEISKGAKDVVPNESESSKVSEEEKKEEVKRSQEDQTSESQVLSNPIGEESLSVNADEANKQRTDEISLKEDSLQKEICDEVSLKQDSIIEETVAEESQTNKSVSVNESHTNIGKERKAIDESNDNKNGEQVEMPKTEIPTLQSENGGPTQELNSLDIISTTVPEEPPKNVVSEELVETVKEETIVNVSPAETTEATKECLDTGDQIEQTEANDNIVEQPCECNLQTSAQEVISTEKASLVSSEESHQTDKVPCVSESAIATIEESKEEEKIEAVAEVNVKEQEITLNLQAAAEIYSDNTPGTPQTADIASVQPLFIIADKTESETQIDESKEVNEQITDSTEVKQDENLTKLSEKKAKPINDTSIASLEVEMVDKPVATHLVEQQKETANVSEIETKPVQDSSIPQKVDQELEEQTKQSNNDEKTAETEAETNLLDEEKPNPLQSLSNTNKTSQNETEQLDNTLENQKETFETESISLPVEHLCTLQAAAVVTSEKQNDEKLSETKAKVETADKTAVLPSVNEEIDKMKAVPQSVAEECSLLKEPSTDVPEITAATAMSNIDNNIAGTETKEKCCTLQTELVTDAAETSETKPNEQSFDIKEEAETADKIGTTETESETELSTLQDASLTNIVETTASLPNVDDNIVEIGAKQDLEKSEKESVEPSSEPTHDITDDQSEMIPVKNEIIKTETEKESTLEVIECSTNVEEKTEEKTSSLPNVDNNVVEKVTDTILEPSPDEKSCILQADKNDSLSDEASELTNKAPVKSEPEAESKNDTPATKKSQLEPTIQISPKEEETPVILTESSTSEKQISKVDVPQSDKQESALEKPDEVSNPQSNLQTSAAEACSTLISELPTTVPDPNENQSNNDNATKTDETTSSEKITTDILDEMKEEDNIDRTKNSDVKELITTNSTIEVKEEILNVKIKINPETLSQTTGISDIGDQPTDSSIATESITVDDSTSVSPENSDVLQETTEKDNSPPKVEVAESLQCKENNGCSTIDNVPDSSEEQSKVTTQEATATENPTPSIKKDKKVEEKEKCADPVEEVSESSENRSNETILASEKTVTDQDDFQGSLQVLTSDKLPATKQTDDSEIMPEKDISKSAADISDDSKQNEQELNEEKTNLPPKSSDGVDSLPVIEEMSAAQTEPTEELADAPKIEVVPNEIVDNIERTEPKLEEQNNEVVDLNSSNTNEEVVEADDKTEVVKDESKETEEITTLKITEDNSSESKKQEEKTKEAVIQNQDIEQSPVSSTKGGEIVLQILAEDKPADSKEVEKLREELESEEVSVRDGKRINEEIAKVEVEIASEKVDARTQEQIEEPARSDEIEKVSEESQSQENSTKDQAITEKVAIVEEADIKSEEKQLDDQEVIKPTAVENILEELKATGTSKQAAKESEQETEVNITEKSDLDIKDDKESIRTEQEDESICESTTLQPKEEQKDEISDRKDDQNVETTVVVSDEGKTEVLNACISEIKEFIDETLPSTDDAKTTCTVTGEDNVSTEKKIVEISEAPVPEVKEDCNPVTEPILSENETVGAAEEVIVKVEEKTDDNIDTVSQEAKDDHLQGSAIEEKEKQAVSVKTKDAPILKEEVQKEDNLEHQEQKEDETCSILKTDDEKIQSIANANTSTLKTDDEKIEEICTEKEPKTENVLMEEISITPLSTSNENNVLTVPTESMPETDVTIELVKSPKTSDVSKNETESQKCSSNLEDMEEKSAVVNKVDEQPATETDTSITLKDVTTADTISIEEDIKNPHSEESSAMCHNVQQEVEITQTEESDATPIKSVEVAKSEVTPSTEVVPENIEPSINVDESPSDEVNKESNSSAPIENASPTSNNNLVSDIEAMVQAEVQEPSIQKIEEESSSNKESSENLSFGTEASRSQEQETEVTKSSDGLVNEPTELEVVEKESGPVESQNKLSISTSKTECTVANNQEPQIEEVEKKPTDSTMIRKEPLTDDIIIPDSTAQTILAKNESSPVTEIKKEAITVPKETPEEVVLTQKDDSESGSSEAKGGESQMTEPEVVSTNEREPSSICTEELNKTVNEDVVVAIELALFKEGRTDTMTTACEVQELKICADAAVEKVSENLEEMKEKIKEEEEDIAKEGTTTAAEEVVEDQATPKADITEEIPTQIVSKSIKAEAVEELPAIEKEIRKEIPMKEVEVTQKKEGTETESVLVEELPAAETNITDEISTVQTIVTQTESTSIKAEAVEELPAIEKDLTEEFPVKEIVVTQEEGSTGIEVEELPATETEEISTEQTVVPQTECTSIGGEAVEEKTVIEKDITEEIPIKEKLVTQEEGGTVTEALLVEELPAPETNITDEISTEQKVANQTESTTTTVEAVEELLDIEKDSTESIPTKEIVVNQEKAGTGTKVEELPAPETNITEDISIEQTAATQIESTTTGTEAVEELSAIEKDIIEQIPIKEIVVTQEERGTGTESALVEKLPAPETNITEEISTEQTIANQTESTTTKAEPVEELPVIEKDIMEQIPIKEIEVNQEEAGTGTKVEELPTPETNITEEISTEETVATQIESTTTGTEPVEELPVIEKDIKEQIPIKEIEVNQEEAGTGTKVEELPTPETNITEGISTEETVATQIESTTTGTEAVEELQAIEKDITEQIPIKEIVVTQEEGGTGTDSALVEELPASETNITEEISTEQTIITQTETTSIKTEAVEELTAIEKDITEQIPTKEIVVNQEEAPETIITEEISTELTVATQIESTTTETEAIEEQTAIEKNFMEGIPTTDKEVNQKQEDTTTGREAVKELPAPETDKKEETSTAQTAATEAEDITEEIPTTKVKVSKKEEITGPESQVVEEQSAPEIDSTAETEETQNAGSTTVAEPVEELSAIEKDVTEEVTTLKEQNTENESQSYEAEIKTSSSSVETVNDTSSDAIVQEQTLSIVENTVTNSEKASEVETETKPPAEKEVTAKDLLEYTTNLKVTREQFAEEIVQTPIPEEDNMPSELQQIQIASVIPETDPQDIVVDKEATEIVPSDHTADSIIRKPTLLKGTAVEETFDIVDPVEKLSTEIRNQPGVELSNTTENDSTIEVISSEDIQDKSNSTAEVIRELETIETPEETGEMGEKPNSKQNEPINQSELISDDNEHNIQEQGFESPTTKDAEESDSECSFASASEELLEEFLVPHTKPEVNEEFPTFNTEDNEKLKPSEPRLDETLTPVNSEESVQSNEKGIVLEDLSIVHEELINVIESLQPEETISAPDKSELKEDTRQPPSSDTKATESVEEIKNENVPEVAEDPPDLKEECSSKEISGEIVDPQNVQEKLMNVVEAAQPEETISVPVTLTEVPSEEKETKITEETPNQTVTEVTEGPSDSKKEYNSTENVRVVINPQEELVETKSESDVPSVDVNVVSDSNQETLKVDDYLPESSNPPKSTEEALENVEVLQTKAQDASSDNKSEELISSKIPNEVDSNKNQEEVAVESTSDQVNVEEKIEVSSESKEESIVQKLEVESTTSESLTAETTETKEEETVQIVEEVVSPPKEEITAEVSPPITQNVSIEVSEVKPSSSSQDPEAITPDDVCQKESNKVSVDSIQRNSSEQISSEEVSVSSVVENKTLSEDKKASDEATVQTPIEVLTATCKIITHPPLEKTESLIASAQLIYEQISEPISESSPDLTTPNLAEELRIADDPTVAAECVTPLTISCESRCFASDPQPNVPQPTSDSTANEQHPNAQDSVQGSIAEREYKKWYNAVDMPNNPYSVEALRRRLSGGPDRVLDLPNISPCVEDKPLPLCENTSAEADMKTQERDYARYSRDYYINDAKHASGITKKSATSPTEIPSPTPTASSIELEDSTPKILTSTPVKEMCHKLEKQGRIDTDLYLATPVRVIEDIPEVFAEAVGSTTPTVLTTEAVSKLSSETSSILTNASLTPSEDSDTIRIYDLKKQETRLVKETTHTTTITVPKSTEKKLRPTELDITPTLAAPIATVSAKSSTPTSFKFLQPKRKLINPSQVLSIDNDATPTTPSVSEKPVIEEEVVHALPSVKALAKAFLMTSTTTTSSSDNKWRKARAKSPLQFFKLTTSATPAASGSKIVQKQLEPVHIPVVPVDTASQGSEDATIASDLSSLETDPPSRIDAIETTENQERVVLSGCLRNNIAFFENLKNK